MKFLALLGTCSLFVFVANAHDESCTETSAAIEGPYYKPNAPFRDDNTVCDYQKVINGTQLQVKGRIYDATCTGDQSAVLDIWTANPQGVYGPQSGSDYTCRGKVKTDANGNYQFLTTIPGRYKERGTYRPAHIHFKFNFNRTPQVILTTQLYFTDDPYIAGDPCPFKACRAGDPTITFPLEPESDKSYLVHFDAVLNNNRRTGVYEPSYYSYT